MTTMTKLSTLLVANRGEIALRVFRTARALGLRTVALATELDADAPHVKAADTVAMVPSYLDIDAVVAAARATGADAVHPGYGFLSERADFARALESAGIRLVGPSGDVMDAMGRKDKARDIAVAAGVPVVPSYGVDDDPATFAYPVLVKAAAGGGGKGMRVVHTAAELPEAKAAAAREAASSFGDDTLLIEKYVESGRHIEVQVVADDHGRVLHFFERDCSTQRRHQKVLEEAPAPTLTDEQRTLVTGSAVALAAEVGYSGAGTVEFLLDNATGEAYFLEMNTRLQVEHPVTEEVARVRGERVDLVELQLLVADGQPLPIEQAEVTVEGHAIEARIYAEDSYGGFLPQAGRAELVRWSPAARNDEALRSGQVVSTSFDPMLGKVIVHGADRESARRALVAALDGTAVLGLTTNTGFVRELTASDAFRDAAIDTAWLDRHELAEPSPDTARVIAAWTQARQASLGDRPGDPFASDGFRLGADPAPVRVELDLPAEVDRRRGLVTVDGRTTAVVELAADDHALELLLDGTREHAVVDARPHGVEVVHHGQRHVFAVPDVFADHGPDVGDGSLLAPMPGTVLDVRVEVGQVVEEGETLGVMEAMKMELALKAPYAGTVARVGAAAGDQVPLGHLLFEVSGDPLVEPVETEDGASDA